ncbi:josephin-like protein [Impatiens glandulifera]|uniref:josephin-like protein n=1 Tax=Impatiens glandulifera TaxID=253017 RepID=UPI001FB0B5F4|nr:josephin-like protein [Impatiens glandulifera]
MATTVTKQGCSRQVSGKKFFFFDGTKRNPLSSSSTTARFRLPRRTPTCLFPLRFLRQIGNKVVGALNLFSGKANRRTGPSSSSAELARSKPMSMAPIIDSHRAEAINDCIEFINSSTLPRTDSTSRKETTSMNSTESILGAGKETTSVNPTCF